MGRIFETDAYRDYWIAAFTDFLEQVDTGTLTPKQAIQRLQNNLPGSPAKVDIAAELAGWAGFIGKEMRDRLADYIEQKET